MTNLLIFWYILVVRYLIDRIGISNFEALGFMWPAAACCHISAVAFAQVKSSSQKFVWSICCVQPNDFGSSHFAVASWSSSWSWCLHRVVARNYTPWRPWRIFRPFFYFTLYFTCIWSQWQWYPTLFYRQGRVCCHEACSFGACQFDLQHRWQISWRDPNIFTHILSDGDKAIVHLIIAKMLVIMQQWT